MIGDMLDPQTRTVPVRIVVPNRETTPASGHVCHRQYCRTANPHAIFVPEDALQDINGMKVVFATSDGVTFQAKTVNVGTRSQGKAEIVYGLNAERSHRGEWRVRGEVRNAQGHHGRRLIVGKLIDFFLDNRWLVVAGLLVLIIGGITVMLHLPIEAFPDLTNNQVVVTVQCPGMSPVEVEQLVTFPIESSMMGMPKLQMVRSTSKLDLSMVTIIFDDSMNKYLVRQLVAERLNQVQSRIPSGLQPQMNPMATAFGEVYQYTVASSKMSLMEIKTLHDWVIRYALLAVPGVSEINSWGGETKQYTIEVDPASLRRYDLSLHDVAFAVTANNANFGGSYIEHAEQQYTVRGLGRAEIEADLGNIVVATTHGVPVLLKQVATIATLPCRGMAP